MSQSNFSHGFQLIRNGQVEIDTDFSGKKEHAVMTIDGKHEHHFHPDSRVSRALHTTPLQEIEQRISGGSFFLQNGQLISFKDGNKKHFTHTDDSIQALIDNIGYTTDETAMGGYNNLNTRKLRLQSVRSNVELEVPGYNAGGDFNSELSFAWSPFETHVSSVFRLVRLICTNGMTGMTNFLNTKIPLVNRWEEHLDIANKQIQNKVTGMMESRFGQMVDQPATVRDIQRVMDHITKRLKVEGNQGSEQTRTLLLNTARMIDPQVHLTGYLSSVFDDGRVADQLPGHISMHTLWNMITELTSHTIAADDSSDFALDKFANEVLFDRLTDSSVGLSGVEMNSNFNNVEAALMHHQL